MGDVTEMLSPKSLNLDRVDGATKEGRKIDAKRGGQMNRPSRVDAISYISCLPYLYHASYNIYLSKLDGLKVDEQNG